MTKYKEYNSTGLVNYDYLCYCSFHPPVSIESESIYDLLEIHYRSFHIQMAQDSKVLWSFRFLPNWTQFHFMTPSPRPLPLHSAYHVCLSVFRLLLVRPCKVKKTPLV